MKSIINVLIALSFIQITFVQCLKRSLDEQWLTFKNDFHKQYRNKIEDIVRYGLIRNQMLQQLLGVYSQSNASFMFCL